jgi:hypothetical protein
MEAATTAKIGAANEDAVRTCTAVPAGLDVAAYSQMLMADIAHMAPTRIELSLAMTHHRFASKFLPATSDTLRPPSRRGKTAPATSHMRRGSARVAAMSNRAGRTPAIPREGIHHDLLRASAARIPSRNLGVARQRR